MLRQRAEPAITGVLRQVRQRKPVRPHIAALIQILPPGDLGHHLIIRVSQIQHALEIPTWIFEHFGRFSFAASVTRALSVIALYPAVLRSG